VRVRLEAALTHFGPHAFLWLTMEDFLREDPIDLAIDDAAERVAAPCGLIRPEPPRSRRLARAFTGPCGAWSSPT
jgi:hypothetical protein